MSMMRMPWTILGQWVAGTAMVAIFAAGCGGIATPGTSTSPFGTLINTDTSKDLLGGVRLHTGEAGYAYGTFKSDGSVDQLTSLVFRDVNGQLSTLYLESGRPSQVVGADGSRLQIFYDEVTIDHLKGTVSYSPAGGDAQVFPFDVDLHKTAQEIRDQVHELTGLQISNEAPPSDAGVTSKPAVESASIIAPGAKSTRDRALIIIVPILLVATGFMIDLVFSQLLGVILDSVTLILRGAILLLLAPFILLGDLLRFALDQPLITFQYNPDMNLIGGAIVEIPRPQVF